jgi:N-acetylglutamate synthase-like GNAT family acetyltransferase
LKTIGKALLPKLGLIELAIPRKEDRKLLERFFTSLSEETILLRFLRPLKNFEDVINRILDNKRTIVAINAVYSGEIIGSAEVYHVKPEVGEYAIVVHDMFQRKGVGTTLTYSSFKLARAKETKKIIAYTHEENEAMKKLALRFKGRIADVLDDLYVIEFNVDKAIKEGDRVLASKGIRVFIG